MTSPDGYMSKTDQKLFLRKIVTSMQISNLTDFDPSKDNIIELVDLLETTLHHDCIRNLTYGNFRPYIHKLLRKNVYLKELYWSNRILESNTNISLDQIWNIPDFSRFPHFINAEFSYIKDLLSQRNNFIPTILFVGCGPFPLTPMAIASYMNANVVCIDRDDRAVSIARSIIDYMGFSKSISVLCTPMEAYEESSDISILPILVGDLPDHKTTLALKLHRLTKISTIIRAPHAVGLICYPGIDYKRLAHIEFVRMEMKHRFLSSYYAIKC